MDAGSRALPETRPVLHLALSSSGENSVGRTARQELTSLGVKGEGQWTIRPGLVLANIDIICAELSASLEQIFLQVVNHCHLEAIGVMGESGQEVDGSSHGKFGRFVLTLVG